MQTQQPNRSTEVKQSIQAAQSLVSSQPWAKPTFERVPLNNALAGGAAGTDGPGTYATS